MAFPISWTDFTGSSEWSKRSVQLQNRGGDVYFIIHHAYNRVVQDTIALSKPGGKQVSMTFAIGPTSPGVSSPIYCVYVVPVEYRPFTTASSLDDRAITVETSNINLNSPYPVAAEAKMLLAQIAAEIHLVYGMPLDAVHILDHSQVNARGYGSYVTECAGSDLRGAIGWIIAQAKAIVAGGSTNERRNTMTTLFYDTSTMVGSSAKGALFALAGDMGTPCAANWWETKDYDLAWALSAVHGSGVALSHETFLERKKAYTTPLPAASIDIGDVTLPSEVTLSQVSVDALAKANAAAFFAEQKKAGN